MAQARLDGALASAADPPSSAGSQRWSEGEVRETRDRLAPASSALLLTLRGVTSSVVASDGDSCFDSLPRHLLLAIEALGVQRSSTLTLWPAIPSW